MSTIKNDLPSDKSELINFIASNLFRFINSKNDNDIKSLLLLVAALSILNNSSDGNALNVSRRLAQAALQRSGKNK